MKKIIIITLMVMAAISIKAQTNKVDQLDALEHNQPDNQNITTTATLKVSSRLFSSKDELAVSSEEIPDLHQ